MEAVVLTSGGIDSLVVAKLLKEEGYKIFPIFIDYGQLGGLKEWEACQKTLELSGLPKPERIDLSGYGKSIKSGLTDKGKDISKEAFLPGRNLLFLMTAASYAYQRGIETIAIGFLNEDTHLFPDQTSEFLVNANFAINSALDKYITITTPLIQFHKKEVIELARKLNLPIDQTYSCHSGDGKYCKKCISCKEILDAGEKGLSQFGGD
jgi:7-cyano-7-deazaguanine synthase